MTGFVIEAVAPSKDFAGPLKLVDLGQSDIVHHRVIDRTKVAWARWRGSRQMTMIETRGRLLLVEGQPDRIPSADEDVRTWLNGRGGSFRGFQLEFGSAGRPVRICAFVDPLGTRPIYLLSTRARICLADKLSTIVANTPSLQCDWGGLLEGAILGSMYSAGTTVRNVEQLLPGEIVEIDGVSISRRCRAPYSLDSKAQPDPNAPVRLRDALRHAVAETWTQPDSRLLLSGGLDSRLILGLAEGKRKTMTITWYPAEMVIVRQVAAACGADSEIIPFVPEDYCERMTNGFLITAAMHQSRNVGLLGMTRRWRLAGIPAITHGYFHNTIFRGWVSERWRRFPDRDSPLYDYMGVNANYFDRFGQYRSMTPKVLALLSAGGRSELKNQLRHLSESIEPVVVDGFDLTFERRVLQQVVRQVYFSWFLSWIEEIDVESPVFYPSVWDWYRSTHPTDRYNDRAVHLAYQTIGRGLADIPDLSSGEPVRPVREDPRARWRNRIWYEAARQGLRAARHIGLWNPGEVPSIPGQDWNKVFRQQPIIEALCAGVEEIRQNPLFDAGLLSSTLAAYLNGDDSQLDALWAVAITGQWHRFVQDAGAGHKAVRSVATNAMTRSGREASQSAVMSQ
jgi:hypothetical protein